MARFKLLMTLAGVSLLLTQLQGSHAAYSEENTPLPKTTHVSCLADINRVRVLANLEPFLPEPIADEKLPTGKAVAYKGDSLAGPPEKFEDFVCSGILTGDNVQDAALYREGSFAFAPQSGAEVDCPAAVSHWLSAMQNFDGLPPEYTGVDKFPYNTINNLSFVAIMNPSDKATISCTYFICGDSVTATTTKTPSTQSTAAQSATKGPIQHPKRGEKEKHGPEVRGKVKVDDDAVGNALPGGPLRRLSDKDDYVGGLVCVSYPPALTAGQQPFKSVDPQSLKEQWAKIVSATNASSVASTAAAVMISLAASALTFAVFVSP